MSFPFKRAIKIHSKSTPLMRVDPYSTSKTTRTQLLSTTIKNIPVDALPLVFIVIAAGVGAAAFGVRELMTVPEIKLDIDDSPALKEILESAEKE